MGMLGVAMVTVGSSQIAPGIRVFHRRAVAERQGRVPQAAVWGRRGAPPLHREPVLGSGWLSEHVNAEVGPRGAQEHSQYAPLNLFQCFCTWITGSRVRTLLGGRASFAPILRHPIKGTFPIHIVVAH